MLNCYTILGVAPSASAAEIKRAYRQKAKELHPDITSYGQSAEDNASRMRELIHAYETLSDPAQRAEFDSVYARYRTYSEGTSRESRFDYRMWLMTREDPESRAKLIFFDLLHDLEDEAVREYQQRRVSPGSFVLSRWFDREDFMDCGFILAEELFFRADYYESFQLLVEVIQYEREKPYFRHFFPEVIVFFRDLVRNKLAGIISDEMALDAFETALELDLGKKDDAVILKLMAGCYERLGDIHTARICLAEALKRDPKLSGVRELSRRLNGGY